MLRGEVYILATRKELIIEVDLKVRVEPVVKST